ncbi:Coiled-coil domain-containing protein 61 [Allomyces javanicus]|nr:Coiled-coil domain-containing protein 61 [Allomyces javanicus]
MASTVFSEDPDPRDLSVPSFLLDHNPMHRPAAPRPSRRTHAAPVTGAPNNADRDAAWTRRTETATLRLRDGHYELVAQVTVPGNNDHTRSKNAPTPTLRLWLSKVADLPLAAAARRPDAAAHDAWTADVTADYVEAMTRKAGNAKQFTVFVEMLFKSMAQSDPCVALDALTADDLAALKARTAPGARSTAIPLNEQKRYLILTYTSAYDRVHYPLPLAYHPAHHEPTTLIRMLKALQDENKHLRHQLHRAEQHMGPNQVVLDAHVVDELYAHAQHLAEEAARAQADADAWHAKYDDLVVTALGPPKRNTATRRGSAGVSRETSTGSARVGAGRRASVDPPRPRPARRNESQESVYSTRSSAPRPHARRTESQESVYSTRSSVSRTHTTTRRDPPPPTAPPTTRRRHRSKDRAPSSTSSRTSYVPLRSAPLHDDSYFVDTDHAPRHRPRRADGSGSASRDRNPAPAPFRRFDPTEWARARAERMRGTSASSTSSRGSAASSSATRREPAPRSPPVPRRTPATSPSTRRAPPAPPSPKSAQRMDHHHQRRRAAAAVHDRSPSPPRRTKSPPRRTWNAAPTGNRAREVPVLPRLPPAGGSPKRGPVRSSGYGRPPAHLSPRRSPPKTMAGRRDEGGERRRAWTPRSSDVEASGSEEERSAWSRAGSLRRGEGQRGATRRDSRSVGSVNGRAASREIEARLDRLAESLRRARAEMV